MKMKYLLPLLAGAAFVAGSAQAANISVTDFSSTPDGSTTTFDTAFDLKTANGGTNVLPGGAANSPDRTYFFTTFNFGAGSNVHIQAHFIASLQFEQDRLGVSVDDDGLVTVFGGGPLQGDSSFNLAQDMAGQSVTILAEILYDVDRNASNDDDSLMNIWVNPTSSDTTASADIFNHVWNSRSFEGFLSQIQNQSTPGTAGDSSISNTVVLTGADATFVNALNLAIVPEASTFGLIGLAGLALFLRRR